MKRMQMIAKISRIAALTAFSSLALTACTQDGLPGSGDSGSSLYELSLQGSQPLPEITNYPALEQFALQNGYYDGQFCRTYLHGGEKVYYSASYDQGEAGQASGTIQPFGSNMFFVQEDMPTTQAMFAPGLGEFSGRSLWEFNRYYKTLCSVAFGKGRNGPDYQNVSAEVVSMTGGTAGGQVAYQNALKVNLVTNNSGGQTQTTIIFAKGVGPITMEFYGDGMPTGTAKVYIQAAGAAPRG